MYYSTTCTLRRGKNSTAKFTKVNSSNCRSQLQEGWVRSWVLIPLTLLTKTQKKSRVYHFIIEIQFLASNLLFQLATMDRHGKKEREKEKQNLYFREQYQCQEVSLPSALSSLKAKNCFCQRKNVSYAKCNKLDLSKLGYYNILSCISGIRHSVQWMFSLSL